MGIASGGPGGRWIRPGPDCSSTEYLLKGGSHLDRRSQVQRPRPWQFSFLQEAPRLFTQKCSFAWISLTFCSREMGWGHGGAFRRMKWTSLGVNNVTPPMEQKWGDFWFGAEARVSQVSLTVIYGCPVLTLAGVAAVSPLEELEGLQTGKGSGYSLFKAQLGHCQAVTVYLWG